MLIRILPDGPPPAFSTNRAIRYASTGASIVDPPIRKESGVSSSGLLPDFGTIDYTSSKSRSVPHHPHRLATTIRGDWGVARKTSKAWHKFQHARNGIAVGPDGRPRTENLNRLPIQRVFGHRCVLPNAHLPCRLDAIACMLLA